VRQAPPPSPQFLDGGIARGKVTTDQKQTVLGRISGTTDVADLASVDAFSNRSPRNVEAKKALLARVAAVVGDDTPT
jgi:3-hydroxybutyryl-CoA dehydrogenase